jgi:hypothetical protein
MNFNDFKIKFLADHPAIAHPLEALGHVGAALETELDKLINEAHKKFLEAEEAVKGKVAKE